MLILDLASQRRSPKAGYAKWQLSICLAFRTGINNCFLLFIERCLNPEKKKSLSAWPGGKFPGECCEAHSLRNRSCTEWRKRNRKCCPWKSSKALWSFWRGWIEFWKVNERRHLISLWNGYQDRVESPIVYRPPQQWFIVCCKQTTKYGTLFSREVKGYQSNNCGNIAWYGPFLEDF